MNAKQPFHLNPPGNLLENPRAPLRSMCHTLMLVFLGFLLAGCDSAPYQIVPTSGVVTLDGKPLEGALLNTQPVAMEGNPNPGPGSFAKTDADGRFDLELVSPPKPGAVVGTHRVRISKLTVKYAPGREDAPVAVRNPLPRNASDGSLYLEVPQEGTDQLQIDLVSR